MVEALTHHSALGWVVEYSPETAGELLKIVQRRISPSTHSAGPLKGFPREARDKGETLLTV
jgi:hypothetical protein